MKIVLWPNKILRQKAKPVKKIDSNAKKIILEIKKGLLSEEALGLSANQVGGLKRIIGVKDQNDQIIILINPCLLYTSPSPRD